MSSIVRLASAEMLPDYGGGSILNLMRSVADACGATGLPYPALAVPCELARSRRLVLLVIDGLGEALLREAGQGTRLAAHRVGGLTSVFPSTTAAAVTTLFTGLPPSAHGLTGWHMHVEEAGGVLAILPLRRRLGRLDPVAPAPAEVPPPERLFAHRGLFGAMQRALCVLSPAEIAFSPFNRFHAGPAMVDGYNGRDDLFERLAGAVRVSRGPAYFHAYYDGLDSLSHAHGAYGEIARAELLALDAAFGRLLDALAGSDTTIVVTADHGFIDSPPDRALDLADFAEIAGLLDQPLCGEPRVAWCYVKTGAEAAFEQAVAQRLGHAAHCVRSRALIESGWFGPPPHHPRLQARIGTHALIMREDWTLRDWLPGERRYRQIGVHGGISKREMQVPLIVARV